MIYASYSFGKRKEKEAGKQICGLGLIPAHAAARGDGRGLASGETAQDGLVAEAYSLLAGAPGPWLGAGFGPAARERGARVHSRPWFTVGLVDRRLGFGELDPLSLPPSSVHGAPGAARAPSPSFPLLSLCSTAPKGTQRSSSTLAPAFFGPCPLLPPLLSARCVPGRGVGARSCSGLSIGLRRPEQRACWGVRARERARSGARDAPNGVHGWRSA
jgi:hypothetical protein